MKTIDFRNTVSKHRCSHYTILMQPDTDTNSHDCTTVTFFYDPQRASTFVWLTADTTTGYPLPVLGGAYRLERDWHISLFTDNARRVWDNLRSKGWTEVAHGHI